MEKIKILEVVPSLQDGGIEHFLYNYMSHMNLDNLDVSILTQNPRYIEHEKKFTDLGIKIYAIPSKRQNLIKYFINTKRIMKDNKFDIVHCHLSAKSFWILHLAKKAKISKRIYHAHESRNLKGIKKIIYRIFANLSLKSATDLFACGEKAAEFCFKNKSKYTIIPNSIEVENFKFNIEDRESIRKELNIKEDVFLIGHVGRYVYEKNHEFIIQLFENIINNQDKSDDKCRLLLIGNGENKERIINYAKELKINDYIIYIDSTNEINKYYSAMDCFILPSLYEGFPVSGVEAQCSGLPVYFSDTIDRKAKINDNCEFISIKDSKEWEKITSIKSNNEYRERLYEDFSKSNFNISVSAKELEKIYMNMCNKKEETNVK